MQSYASFSILDSVDSTNNYAMARVHEGMAKHGSAWFARHQTAGKGQRGKAWQSLPGSNITFSLIIKPDPTFFVHHFSFNATVALACINFLHSITGENYKLKWPNDIYWRDRKAGGILIENVLQGNNWKWCVLGIGINVNQTHFEEVSNAVSLKNITGKDYEPITLAKQLHKMILERNDQMKSISSKSIMQDYNNVLYKKEEEVQLKKDNIIFKTRIKEVNEYGNLLTQDVMERSFVFGEVAWIPEINVD
ncbi:MAG: biotin--[acetyl-CoA-carboxylase] ligase [Ferruginibacter sp.]